MSRPLVGNAHLLEVMAKFRPFLRWRPLFSVGRWVFVLMWEPKEVRSGDF